MEDADDPVDLLARRRHLLGALADDRLTLGELADRTDVSKSTASRAVRRLAAAGFVEGSDDSEGYALTPSGRLALDAHRAHRRRVEGVVAAQGALDPLPADAPLVPAVLSDAEVVGPSDGERYRAPGRLRESLREADRVRAALPTVSAPTARLLYDRVVRDDAAVEVVVSPAVRESLAARFGGELRAMAAEEFELLTGEVPSFGVVVAETGDRTVVTVVVVVDGGVHAVIRNDAEAAVRWAESTYADLRSAATPVTASVARETGASDLDDGRGGLPVALEREGFVALDRSYFVDSPVADPATAWRAGLDVAEVQSGYAADRTTDEGESLTDRLLAALTAGEDTLVVGPPGSGKSTVCKQVACEWYDAGHGPVLYRERGRGAAVESVDDLVAAVEATDGHTLVVVEDVVQPGAVGAVEAARRLAGASVSFLFDARLSEWHDPPAAPATDLDALDLAVEPMPSLDDTDYRRVVEQFERTAETTIDVPVERLRETIEGDRGPGGDGAAPDEVLLLTHRLALYADPLAEDSTTLEEAVERLRERVSEEEHSVSVATTAAALTAAGVPFGPGHLHALAEPGEETAERTVDLLDGRLLFGVGDDGTYRTVHEAWATAFLAAAADAERATERFGRAISRLLALADDPRRRERLRQETEASALPRVEAAPTEWADETAEALFSLARERPKVVPLFGASGASVDLPAACERVTEADLDRWLGRAALNRGDPERAERAFESLPDEGVVRPLGLAEVAHARDDYDAAEEHARTALERARRGDDRGRVAECLNQLGWVDRKRGDLDRAGERFRRSLEIAREAGDRRSVRGILTDLGTVERMKGALEDAREHYLDGLELARALGDRQGEAIALHNLGNVAFDRGAHDRAREQFQRALDLCETIGDRDGVAGALNNLGMVAGEEGDLDRAREFFERALAENRRLGDPESVGGCLNNLGKVAVLQDDLDRAREYAREGQSVFVEIGHVRGEANALGTLADVAERRGNTERAREHLQEALDRYDRMGAVREGLETVERLQDLERESGDDEAAREWCERALERIDAADDLDLAERREEFRRLRDELAPDSEASEPGADPDPESVSGGESG